jgi:hypothetical protein
MAKEKVLGGGEGTAVDLRARVTIIATDKHKYSVKGNEHSVAPAIAEKLIKKGWATKAK